MKKKKHPWKKPSSLKGNSWLFRRKVDPRIRDKGDMRAISSSESQRGMKNNMGIGLRGIEVMDNETLSSL